MAERIGQQLGNYQLVSLLGHGGFADVYLGEHVYLKTQAAVKVLHTQLDQEDVEQFRTEAQTIAHLAHPHIIRVLDFDVDNYTPLLVMDYAPNGNLRKRHPKGTRVAPDIFLPYVRQVASALQYAHNQKLIHRDVKPENMLIGRNNEILLSDFGIALVAQSSHSQSTEDMVIGTMSYMAPEQIQGKPRPASDQYALGVVVYEWLTGVKPFQGSYIEVVTQHLSTPPPPLRDTVPNLPPQVEGVVQKALAKDPHQRFPQVEDFAQALEEAFQARPVEVRASATTQADAVPNRPGGRPAGFRNGGIQTKPRPKQEHVITGPRGATEVEPEEGRQIGTMAPLPQGDPLKKGLRVVKRGFSTLLLMLSLCAAVVCGSSYLIYSHVLQSGGNTADTGAATALANNFVQAVSQRNYDLAYNELGPQVTRDTPVSKFKQNAGQEDSCDGVVTTYKNTRIQTQGNKQIYTYTITRSKMSKTYQLTLTLQPNSNGNWEIADYNSNIDSVQPSCANR